MTIASRLFALLALLIATTSLSAADRGLGVVPLLSGSSLTSGRVPFATTGGLLSDATTLLFDSANAQLKVGDGATANVALIINGPVGARDIRWQSATSNRWIFRIDATAEAGSDVGSNIDLRASNDSGTYIDSPIYINRAAGGAVTIGRPITLNSYDLTIATVGKGLRIKEGSNARMGNSTLASGTVTVSNTSVTASTRFHLTPHGSTIAAVGISAVSAGTSFTIKSSSGTDTNTVDWILVEPSP